LRADYSRSILALQNRPQEVDGVVDIPLQCFLLREFDVYQWQKDRD
jgi:hypothetical protein